MFKKKLGRIGDSPMIGVGARTRGMFRGYLYKEKGASEIVKKVGITEELVTGFTQ